MTHTPPDVHFYDYCPDILYKTHVEVRRHATRTMGKEPTYKPVPELVEDVANRVAILREGRVAAFDTMDGLRQSSGVNAKLDEVYERLVGDGSLDNIDRYFEERP